MPKRPTGVEERRTADGGKAYRGWYNDRAAQRTVKGPWGSMPEAIQWRARKLLEQAEDNRPQSELPLRELAADFFDGAKAGTVRDRSGRPYKPSTLRGYERGWKRIDPLLGSKSLRDIRRADIQALVDRWAADGLAPSTIRNTLDPLRAIYRRAVKRELVATNPTIDLDVPFDRDEEMRFASPAEVRTLLDALPSDDRAVWATAFYAGLRRGELRALRCEDVDFTAGVIHVRRTLDDCDGEQEPKTRAGRRRVPIIAPLRAELRAHLLRCGRREGPIFPFEPGGLRRRALAAWETAGSAPITLHQCRHTCASFFIAAGVNAKAISALMGHASIAITFDRYGHLMPGGEGEAGTLVERYLGEGTV